MLLPDKAVFFRSLSNLLESGVALDCGLEAVNAGELAVCLRQGHTLSHALQTRPAQFSARDCALVRVGERSGALVAVLSSLSRAHELELERRMRLRKSLTVPLLTAAFCLLMSLVIPPLVLAGMLDGMAELGVPLPWTSRLLLAWSALLRHPLFWGGMVAAVWLLLRFGGRLSRPFWQLRLWALGLRLPMLGRCLNSLQLARFLSSLRDCYQVGLPLLEGLKLSRQSLANVYYSQRLITVELAVSEGEELEAALAATGLFPKLVLSGIGAGEVSGSMVRMLTTMADMLEQDLQRSLEVWAATLEPLVMVVVGAMVGLMLVATLQPTLSMLEAL